MSSETPASAIARYTRVCAAMCSGVPSLSPSETRTRATPPALADRRGDAVGSVGRDVGDERALVVAERVLHAHGDARVQSQLRCGRVHDAAAGLGHLEQLVGADDLEDLGAVTRARVCRHDAVDVGVDLDLIGAQGDSERARARVATRRDRVS